MSFTLFSSKSDVCVAHVTEAGGLALGSFIGGAMGDASLTEFLADRFRKSSGGCFPGASTNGTTGRGNGGTADEDG